jgi:hypothetical protein
MHLFFALLSATLLTTITAGATRPQGGSAVPSRGLEATPQVIEYPHQDPRFFRRHEWLKEGAPRIVEGPYLARMGHSADLADPLA